jgi:glycerol-3-phosphate O-acyltransferase / dihydroxyacetone phosphate acyltransferase
MKILGNFLITIPKVAINLLFSLAGLTMLTPLGILNKYLAEKARKEALAGSSVKVIGADVMASKKLTTTILLYPILCIGFTAWFYYVISKLTELPLLSKLLWTFVFFVFFPLYSYVCILSRDNLVRYHQLMYSRLMCLFFTEDMFVLKQMRKNLKAKIRGIIDKFGPEMFEDFDQMRGFKRKGSINSESNLLSLVDHRANNRNSDGNGSFISRGSA